MAQKGKKMKFDELLFSHLGEFGRYQKIQFALICIPPMFVAMQSLSWTFTASSLPHRCRVSEDEPSNASYWLDNEFLGKNCSSGDQGCRYETCRLNGLDTCPYGYVYDHSEITNSAVNRWDIVCERGVLKAVIQSAYYIGQMIGSLAFGFLGDRIGRKIVFFVALIILMFAGSAMSVAPHWSLFGLLRMSVGAAHPGIFTIGVVIATELVGPSKRKMASIITGISFALGQVVLGTLAYFLRDYQYLQMSISLPVFVFLIYWSIIPESARWLVSQKRYEEANRILQRAAKTNGTSLPENWWEQLDVMDDNGDRVKQREKKYGYADLIRTPIIRKRTLTCFFLWPIVSMIYYGVSMKTDFLGGSLYTTFIIGSLSEIPALFLLNCVADRFGRKPIFAGAYFVAALCMLSNLLMPVGAHWLISMLQFLLTKAAITICYAVIYMITPEMFPTVIRNIAVGCCSTIARVGAISASYIAMWLVESVGSWAMVVPFGSLSLAAGIVVLILVPETMGQPLPETINEVEMSAKNVDGKELALIEDSIDRDNNA